MQYENIHNVLFLIFYKFFQKNLLIFIFGYNEKIIAPVYSKESVNGKINWYSNKSKSKNTSISKPELTKIKLINHI